MLKFIRKEAEMNEFKGTYQITHDCMDNNYRLKPLSLLMFFQDCFARYLTFKNLAAFDVSDENIFWVIAECSLEITDILPFWSEEVVVKTKITEFSKLKIYVDYEIFHNEKLFAKGESCWFILDTETRRPLPVSRISERIGLPDGFCLRKHSKKVNTPALNKIKEISHIANYNDTDFNNHVNNRVYLNLAEVAFNKDLSEKTFPEYLYVKFIKESFEGDNLECSVYDTDRENFLTGEIRVNGEIVCHTETKRHPEKDLPSVNDVDLSVRKIPVLI